MADDQDELGAKWPKWLVILNKLTWRKRLTLATRITFAPAGE